MRAKIRHVVFGELAVLAAALNNACYELAIKFNRLHGWLIARRDALPDGG